jgi:GxxExxY protein
MNLKRGTLIDGELSGTVIGGFYAVYNDMGFGYAENVHSNALDLELRLRGLLVEREKPVQVYYRDQAIALFKLDMLVEKRLVVEIKTGKSLADIEQKQLFNYLRSTDLTLGLLLHFGPSPQFKRVICTRKRHCLIVPPSPSDPFNPRQGQLGAHPEVESAR